MFVVGCIFLSWSFNHFWKVTGARKVFEFMNTWEAGLKVVTSGNLDRSFDNQSRLETISSGEFSFRLHASPLGMMAERNVVFVNNLQVSV